MPNRALPADTVSFDPCWVQTEPERVNTDAAPALSLSLGAPISAVLPSEESATLLPKSTGNRWPTPVSSEGISVACFVQAESARVNTDAVPMVPDCPSGAPISAVLPSEDSATLTPNSPPASGSVSFDPCWAQAEPVRVNTQAAPAPLSGPPISAVFAVR